MGDGRQRETRMKIQLLETSVRNNQQYDISEISSFPKWTTNTNSQPGKLEFEMLDDKNVFLLDGDIIELKIDGRNIFKGKVFVRERKKEGKWRVVAYDTTRYLQNEDTLVFAVSTASNRFKMICQAQGLAYKVLDASSYNCVASVEDKNTYYSMLETAITETRQQQKTRYSFWDNYGTLEFFDLNRMITKLVIGDNSLLTDYSYSASIDDAANAVKVVRENSDSGKREIYTAQNTTNISRWGKLQVVETISDADLNSSQLQAKANALLSEKNSVAKTLSIEAIGNLEIRAGKCFILRLSDLTRDGIGNDNLALVTSCQHDFSDGHTMSLEIEVI